MLGLRDEPGRDKDRQEEEESVDRIAQCDFVKEKRGRKGLKLSIAAAKKHNV